MKKRNAKEVMLVAATVILALVVGSGCTITKFRHPIQLDAPQDADSTYKYYVIDINSDTPDAFFETLEEASDYQKEFADTVSYTHLTLQKNREV